MLSLLFIALAALCNSIMDVTMFRYSNSIFYTDNPFWKTWWSDRAKRFWIVQLNDAWHFFKMWMIVFFILAVVFYKPIYIFYIDFWVYGLIWNVVFNLFFDVIWLKE